MWWIHPITSHYCRRVKIRCDALMFNEGWCYFNKSNHLELPDRRFRFDTDTLPNSAHLQNVQLKSWFKIRWSWRSRGLAVSRCSRALRRGVNVGVVSLNQFLSLTDLMNKSAEMTFGRVPSVPLSFDWSCLLVWRGIWYLKPSNHLWFCFRFSVQRWDHVRCFTTAGEQQIRDPETSMVGGRQVSEGRRPSGQRWATHWCMTTYTV